MTQSLRLGTRRSPLALYQAGMVRDAVLAAFPDTTVELIELVSDGDRDTRPLREIGARGIFAHTLERALRAGEIDAAVHSSKDVELEHRADLVLAAWLPRADARDALVGPPPGTQLQDLPEGACIATGSVRRVAQLRTVRADLHAVDIRGNVATRIAQARERGDAGTLLAMAGLDRLGLAGAHDITPLSLDQFVPEAGQGAVVVQACTQLCPRSGVDWSRIDDVSTRRTVELERELARLLGGGCTQPIGVHVDLATTTLRAFGAPAPATAGQVVVHELVGLELAPLLSVSGAADIADAVSWAARQLAPQLGAHLGIDVEVDAR